MAVSSFLQLHRKIPLSMTDSPLPFSYINMIAEWEWRDLIILDNWGKTLPAPELHFLVDYRLRCLILNEQRLTSNQMVIATELLKRRYSDAERIADRAFKQRRQIKESETQTLSTQQ